MRTRPSSRRGWFSEVVSKGDMSSLDDIAPYATRPSRWLKGDPARSTGHLRSQRPRRAPAHARRSRTSRPRSRSRSPKVRSSAGLTMNGHQGEFIGMPATGKPFTVGGASIWEVRGGQLISEWVSWDSDGHAAAARGDNSRARFLTDLRPLRARPGRRSRSRDGKPHRRGGHLPVTPRWRSVRPRLHTRRHHRRRCRRRSHSSPGRGPTGAGVQRAGIAWTNLPVDTVTLPGRGLRKPTNHVLGLVEGGVGWVGSPA